MKSCVFILAVLLLVVPEDEALLLSALYENEAFLVKPGVIAGCVASVNFTDHIERDGWAYLEVKSSQEFRDIPQSYAAGLVEGVATYELIYNHWRNTMEGYCDWKGKEYCERLKNFLHKNFQWMKMMIATQASASPVWHQVQLVLSQINGIVDGYNRASPDDRKLGPEDIVLLNLMGDLEDLEQALNPALQNMTQSQWFDSGMLRKDGHCSALIKVLPRNVDLFVSQVTWNSYQSMLRINKKYSLPLRKKNSSMKNETIPGALASFSSYPGIVYSGDDFYILSSQLVTLETTIGNSNPDLWKDIKPTGALLEFIRTVVANRLATDGKSWCDYFSLYNSGTYNNQWMVVDYKLFNRTKSIKPNTLWVLEQLPGHVKSSDQSQLLRTQTYWPSYNIAFYPDIFNMSGGPALVEKYGDWFSYEMNPRARIFRRDHSKVTSYKTMIKLMRYNDYKNDVLSRCDCVPPFSAENAISARNDLNPKNGTYPFSALGHRSHGGTDMKLTSYELTQKMKYLAVSGPTNDQQPSFQWSKQDFANDTPHYGHPDLWDFPVVLVG